MNRDNGLDVQLKAALLCVACTGLALAILALVLYDVRAALGVALGGAIATANLWVFAQLGRGFLTPGGVKGPWVAVAMLKVVVLFGGVWWVLKHEIASGVALAIGYGALPLGIVIGTLFAPKRDEQK